MMIWEEFRNGLHCASKRGQEQHRNVLDIYFWYCLEAPAIQSEIPITIHYISQHISFHHRHGINFHYFPSSSTDLINGTILEFVSFPMSAEITLNTSNGFIFHNSLDTFIGFIDNFILFSAAFKILFLFRNILGITNFNNCFSNR